MEFLSEAWAAALDESLASARIDSDIELSIEYRSGDFAYRIVVADGRASATTDLDGEADVRISADPSVAAAINAGTQSALQAFMDGSVVVGGDLSRVIAHQELLAVLGSAFAPVAGHSD